MMSKDQLAALAAVEAEPVVSIYLPTHEKGREVRQDPIRYRNAVNEVIGRLAESGRRRPEAEELMAPALSLLEEEFFWRHQAKGLAVFVAPGLFQVHKLPAEVPEMQVVANRPHLMPLLPLLADDGRYYVLTAQADDTRLYLASRHGLAEVEDVDIPRSVAEVTAETDYENTFHGAPPARPRSGGPTAGLPAIHNFGDDPEEQRKAQLIEHLRRVHNALERELAGDNLPIVLVAQPEVRGHLHALAKNVKFLEEGVQVDPDTLDEAQLHARTYEVVRPLFAKGREEALDRFRALAGSGDQRGAVGFQAVVPAAFSGRVDTLFLAEGQSVRGRYDRGRDAASLPREGETIGVEDLTDAAAVRTLLAGGHVQVLPKEEMPRDTAMCAILRY